MTRVRGAIATASRVHVLFSEPLNPSAGGTTAACLENRSDSSSDTENAYRTVVAPLALAQRHALRQIGRSFKADPDRLDPRHVVAVERALVFAGERGFERSGRADGAVQWLHDNPEEDRAVIWSSDLIELEALRRALTVAGISHTGQPSRWRARQQRVLITTGSNEPIPEGAVVLSLGPPPGRHSWESDDVTVLLCEEGEVA